MTEPAAPLVVVAATAMEMAAVFRGLGIDAAPPADGMALPVPVAGREVLFALTGVGPVNAGIAAGRLLGYGNGRAGLVCLGIAGTYSPTSAPIGSAVVATREAWPEYGLAGPAGVDAKALGFPQFSPPPVWDSLDLEPQSAFAVMKLPYLPATAPRDAGNPLAIAGAGVTVAGVTGTRERARELCGKYSALTESMEGFALALAAHQAAVPFGEVRTVSNIVGERDPSAWNMPAALAALERTARLLLGAQRR